MNIGCYFENELTDLIERYSGQEMTNAECVGFLMFKVNEIMNQVIEEEGEE